MTFQSKSALFESGAQVIPFPTRSAQTPFKRPPTLTRAARWRATRYRSARDLPRLAAGLSSTRAGSDALLARLREIEEECWRALKDGAAHYSAERHVLALAALIAEGGLPARTAGQRTRR